MDNIDSRVNDLQRKLQQTSPNTNEQSDQMLKTLMALVLTMIHAETRKQDLVDKLFHLGLSVSYDRLLQVSATLANRITDRFDLATGVHTPSLRSGLFTTTAVDNIDHNPTSTTAADSFHGTGISLVQHCCSDDKGLKVVLPSFDCGQQTTKDSGFAPIIYQPSPGWITAQRRSCPLC